MSINLQQMHRAKLNSPETNITGSISATDTQFSVVDISTVTPDDGIFPILLMIGGNRSDCETVELTAIIGNTLTVKRGYKSVARAWEADENGRGELIAANFGAQHHNTFIDSIEALADGSATGIELSDTDTPAEGIKIHYRVMRDVEGFIPFTPTTVDPDTTAEDVPKAAFMTAVEILTTFSGAKLAELRIFDPEGNFNSVIPVTALEAVKDVENGVNLLNILANHYATIFGHILNTDVHVTAEYINNLDQLLAGIVAFTQREDIFVTADQTAAWDLMAQIANDAIAIAKEGTGKLTDHEAHILQLENALFNRINTNPFLVTFGNLAGVIVIRGIHDTVYRRIEC